MKRKLLLGLMIGLLVAGCVLWILTFPFREALVLRAIPADATYISVHARPGLRLPAILQRGVADPVLRAFGLDPSLWVPELLADEGFTWLRTHLGRRYVAVGYVERFGGTSSPAWVASTWMGGLYTHVARMGLLDQALGTFRVEHSRDTGRIWTQFYPDLPPGFQHVSFGIYEGVAFGCASDDPMGAQVLARQMRRQQDNGVQALWEEAPGAVSLDGPDRGVWRGGAQADDLHVSLEWGAAGKLHLALAGSEAQIGQLPTALLGKKIPAEVAALLALAGDESALLLATGTSRLVALLRELPIDRMLRDAAVLLQTHAAQPDGATLVWLAGGAQGGRLMRIRVPALALAFTVREDVADTRSVLELVLQRLQAAHQLDWQAEPYGQNGVYALQPPPIEFYSRFPAKERAGFVVQDGWAILHSHAESLDRLVAAQQALGADPIPAWARTAGWYARMDGPAMAEVIRTALAGYGLWQMAQGHTRDRAQETWIKRLAQVVDGYALGQLHVREVDDRQWGAIVEIKVPDPAAPERRTR